MNIKRVFGTVLTVLGSGGLIYAVYAFINEMMNVTEIIVVGVVGLIFFTSGIGLIQRTKDKSEPDD